MPPYRKFRSKAQMKAAFAGGLGKKMKSEAVDKAHATPNLRSLPDYVQKNHQQKSDTIRGRSYKK